MISLVMNWADWLLLVAHARFLHTCKFCTIDTVDFVGILLKITFHTSVLYSDLNLVPGPWCKVDSPGGVLLNLFLELRHLSD